MFALCILQATEIGARILRSGGNAVDAAVAISAATCGKLALAVALSAKQVMFKHLY